ncbi:hypothetical protein EDB87DRAFT_1321586 [Lactarius vividus]|nr:hypothetical protein EDB87DRAFT_1321586 [Lactarius vividus]
MSVPILLLFARTTELSLRSPIDTAAIHTRGWSTPAAISDYTAYHLSTMAPVLCAFVPGETCGSTLQTEQPTQTPADRFQHNFRRHHFYLLCATGTVTSARRQRLSDSSLYRYRRFPSHTFVPYNAPALKPTSTTCRIRGGDSRDSAKSRERNAGMPCEVAENAKRYQGVALPAESRSFVPSVEASLANVAAGTAPSLYVIDSDLSRAI